MLSAAEMSTSYARGRPPLKSVKVCILAWFYPYSASIVSLIASMPFTCQEWHTWNTSHCPKVPDAAALMHVIYKSATRRMQARTCMQDSQSLRSDTTVSAAAGEVPMRGVVRALVAFSGSGCEALLLGHSTAGQPSCWTTR